MLLDFLDALAGAVVIAGWWCTWVSPGPRPPSTRVNPNGSEHAEIERFLVEVRACPLGGMAPADYVRDELGRLGSPATGASDPAERPL